MSHSAPPDQGVTTPPACASCGDPAPHTITRSGEPTPVCLRHLNHWRTPSLEHGYGDTSDCLCGRNFEKVRGLREHITKARREEL